MNLSFRLITRNYSEWYRKRYSFIFICSYAMSLFMESNVDYVSLKFFDMNREQNVKPIVLCFKHLTCLTNTMTKMAGGSDVSRLGCDY